MAFPSPSLFESEDRAARYRANRKAKCDALKAEVIALREQQKERAPAKPVSTCSPEWIDFLTSPGFKDWYEELTCKSGDKFVQWLLTSDAHLAYRESREKWVARSLQNLLEANRWANPHYRRYWAKHIVDCADPVKRRAIMLRLATPKWACMKEVAAFHRMRRKANEKTGVPHHVDHIVPLQGVNVCGLNNEFNLRVIPASENMAKSNRFEIA